MEAFIVDMVTVMVALWPLMLKEKSTTMELTTVTMDNMDRVDGTGMSPAWIIAD